MTEPLAVSPPAPAPRAAMYVVFFVVVIDLLGFGIVLPILPRLGNNLIGPAGIGQEYAGLLIGGLMSVFSLMQFVFSPIWGRVSDRVGRRPVILVGLVGSVVFYALFGFACSLGSDQAQLALILMFAARIGAGVSGATISTAQAVIADCTTKEKRAHGMAYIGIAFGIGFTIGPVLAGAALSVFPDDLQVVGYLAATLSLFALLLAVAKLPESRTPSGPGAKRSWLNVGQLFETLRTPTVGILVLIFFLATFGFAKFEGTLALLTADFHYTETQTFWIFAYVGFVLMMTQGFFYRKLVKKHGEVACMRFGVGFMFLGLAGIAAVVLGQDMPLKQVAFFVALALGVVGFAFLTPSAQSLISRRSDPNRQGEILGVNQAFSALARILGPFLGIILFKAYDPPVLPYAAAALLLVAVLALLPRVK